jgi:hypothetical protein
MVNNKTGFVLILQGLIVILLLFGLVKIVAGSHGLLSLLELVGLVTLLVLSFVGFVNYGSWGERVIFLVFSLSLAHLVVLWRLFDSLYLILMLLSLAGFLMSIPRRKRKKVSKSKPKPKAEIPKPIEKTPAKKVVAEHSPGKYIATKRSNIYHEPKCEWAKKINSKRRLWFEDKKEAQKKGYRKHSCVN